MKVKDFFEDYKVSNIGKKICIELEVTKDDAYKTKRKYNTTVPYRESDNIYEILNVHNLKTKERKDIYNHYRDLYKETFPVGYDTYLSGGVHFHAFLKQQMNNNNAIVNKLSVSEYSQNFLHLPLFAKVNNFCFYARPTGFDFSQTGDSLFHRMGLDRSYTGGLRKTFRTHGTHGNGSMSIEFRCNNVIDTRLYGYYIGMLLLAEEGIKLQPLSKTITPIQTRFNRDILEVNIKDISNGTHYNNEEDKTKIKTNLKLLLLVLKNNGFTNAAKHLKAYAKSVAIL